MKSLGKKRFISCLLKRAMEPRLTWLPLCFLTETLWRRLATGSRKAPLIRKNMLSFMMAWQYRMQQKASSPSHMMRQRRFVMAFSRQQVSTIWCYGTHLLSMTIVLTIQLVLSQMRATMRSASLMHTA